MRLVYLESPFAGDRERNVAYLKACMLDSLRRGEAPFASHALYVQFLDDDVPDERALGIAAGLAWGDKAEATVVYHDFGVTRGMQLGIDRAEHMGRPIEYRVLHWQYTPVHDRCVFCGVEVGDGGGGMGMRDGRFSISHCKAHKRSAEMFWTVYEEHQRLIDGNTAGLQ